MAGIPLSALLGAFGIALALEIPVLLLRRQFPGLLERLRFQLWVLAVAGLAFEAFGGGEHLAPIVFDILQYATIVLTVDLGYRAIDRLWLAKIKDRAGRHLVPQLVRDLFGWLVLTSVLVGAGSNIFHWELGKWALPSAVVSAVLGFALQDVLKNVFAGLALQTETPFDIGDWLLVDGDPREVIEMTWRSTHLRNNLFHDFREPNANLSNAGITNLGSGKSPMAFEVHVGVVYGAPPAQVKRSLETAARSSRHVVAEPPPVGLVEGFGDSAVLYKIRFWTRDVFRVARVMDDVSTRVWYQLARDGFAIPFPLRTVQFESQADIRADADRRVRERVYEMLSKSDLFGPLSNEVRSRLAAVARSVHFDVGEKLMVEGQAGDSLLLVARGLVSVSKSGASIGATTVSLATLGEGAYFGEMSLLTGSPRSATVTAEEPVEVFVLDRVAIAPVLESDPTLAEPLSKVLAERSAATQARFENRREELSRLVDTTHQSILKRIRSLFALGGDR